jgi:signal recognition particle subunit SRP54
MFESLGKKLQSVVRDLSGQSAITEKNIQDALRDVRVALLEADVNFQVAKDFVARAREKALGAEVIQGINPGQYFIKLVYDELVEVMGGAAVPFQLDQSKTNVIMLLGLQGSGKTTFSAKLAKMLKKDGWKPMLVACDVYRPAAVKQLLTVGAQVGVSVFEMGTETPVVTIAREALRKAEAESRNVVILDTAGRLHIDEMKMEELVALRDFVHPRFTFLVSDSMTGQDAVNSASRFHEVVGIDGVCLTKLDGDARGGAALSVKTVTGRPIYFAGTGEHLDDLEVFHPDRMASRILGMGDVLTLVEKAQEAFDEEESLKLRRDIRKGAFTLDDFMKHMKRMRKMGSMRKMMSMIPGMGQLLEQIDEGEMEREIGHTEAIIGSMTPMEREQPTILSGSRRARIAKGSGRPVQALNKLLKDFEMTRRMMKDMMNVGGGNGKTGKMAGLMNALSGGGEMPASAPAASGHGGVGKSKKALKKQQKKKRR